MANLNGGKLYRVTRFRQMLENLVVKMRFRDILKEKSETHHAQFISIVENLKNSYLSFTTPVFYTSHGIDHSLNIENIADALIPDHLKYKMNQEEIFILLCSIYFHDVGMALMTKDEGSGKSNDYFKRVDEVRRTHSEKTASFMIEKYEEFGLRKSQAEIISWICKAHSDIKNTDGTKIYTFAEIMNRSDEINIDTVPIRIKYLAAILRLGDELDVTEKRAPGKRMEIIDLPLESQIEWMKHQIFSGINIDPNIWEIDLDVSESLLYGGEKNKDQREIAFINKLVTDSAIKIRKSLMEVKSPLIKEGVLYQKIRFRDIMIKKLEKVVTDHDINLNGITILDGEDDTLIYGGCIQNFISEVEELGISPEYSVSKKLDERLFQGESFLLHFENNLHSDLDRASFNKIQETVINFLSNYIKRRSIKKTIPFENKIEEYTSHIDSAGSYILERNILEEFIVELKYEIKDVIENEDIFQKQNEDVDLFIKLVITDIIKDLFTSQRRRIMLNKLFYHHYLHVIPKSYFINVLTLSTSKKDKGVFDFKQTLYLLKKLIVESGGNFKLYCHDNNINLDYRIIASEMILLPGRSPSSNVVITETEAIIQFYDDFHRILNSSDTWFIEDIDTENFTIKLGRDEKFQGTTSDHTLAQCKKLEQELNAILSKIIKNSIDDFSDK